MPNLFPNDDKAEICEKMRGIDRQKDRSLQTDGSPLALFNLFVERAKQQLHIVLALSPIGDGFRNRLRKFPSLVNCCTIDWFENWPEDALVAVSTRFLADIELTEAQREAASFICRYFHQSTEQLSGQFFAELGRHNYVTPTSYLEMISTFKNLLHEKRQ